MRGMIGRILARRRPPPEEAPTPEYLERLSAIVGRARAVAFIPASNRHVVIAAPDCTIEQTARIYRFDAELTR
jgi:hypothetical protein